MFFACTFCFIEIICCVTMQFVLIFDNYVYQVDPFLRLVDDLRLQALDSGIESVFRDYGSKEDNDFATKSLSNIKLNDQSKQIAVSLILDSLKLSDVSQNDTRAYSCFDIFCFCSC